MNFVTKPKSEGLSIQASKSLFRASVRGARRFALARCEMKPPLLAK
jgi:hypothetical protein